VTEQLEHALALAISPERLVHLDSGIAGRAAQK
jgi:hypothetical protein